jgi:hypothetical protein
LKFVFLAAASLLVFLIGQSLDWPLVMDTPLMHYTAWLISQGAVPYRDFFDMNFPGAYVIHLAVLSTLGGGDGAWRAVDLGWLLATMGVIVLYCRGIGDPLVGPVAAVLFGLYHLAGGAIAAGERDYLLCLFLITAAYQLVRYSETGAPLRPLAWCGLALGTGLVIKPFVAVAWLSCAIFSIYRAKRLGRPAAAALATIAASSLIVPGAAVGWLAWRGGLRPFVQIVVGYLVPLYSQVGRGSIRGLVSSAGCDILPLCGHGTLGARVSQIGLVLALLVALITALRERLDIRHRIATAGMLYGVFHFFFQGKSWAYQLYPLTLFTSLSIPLFISRLVPAGSSHPFAMKLMRGMALTLMVTLIGALGAKTMMDPERSGGSRARAVEAVVHDLSPFITPGETVQVMDTTDGGIHALLKLGVRQPSRFIYDFHFYDHEADPRIQALRNEFIGALATRRPAAIVVFKTPWIRRTYAPAVELLGDLLTHDYFNAVERDEYRIYARRGFE